MPGLWSDHRVSTGSVKAVSSGGHSWSDLGGGHGDPQTEDGGQELRDRREDR